MSVFQQVCTSGLQHWSNCCPESPPLCSASLSWVSTGSHTTTCCTSSSGRMHKALREKYGIAPSALGFFDLFANMPSFEKLWASFKMALIGVYPHDSLTWRRACYKAMS